MECWSIGENPDVIVKKPAPGDYPGAGMQAA
jgi:hypothetical protein